MFSLPVGLVVPIPTLPELSLLMRSVVVVPVFKIILPVDTLPAVRFNSPPVLVNSFPINPMTAPLAPLAVPPPHK